MPRIYFIEKIKYKYKKECNIINYNTQRYSISGKTSNLYRLEIEQSHLKVFNYALYNSLMFRISSKIN